MLVISFNPPIACFFDDDMLIPCRLLVATVFSSLFSPPQPRHPLTMTEMFKQDTPRNERKGNKTKEMHELRQKKP